MLIISTPDYKTVIQLSWDWTELCHVTCNCPVNCYTSRSRASIMHQIHQTSAQNPPDYHALVEMNQVFHKLHLKPKHHCRYITRSITHGWCHVIFISTLWHAINHYAWNWQNLWRYKPLLSRRHTSHKLVPETGNSRLVPETCTCAGQSGTRFFWYQILVWNRTQLYSITETVGQVTQTVQRDWPVCCYCFCCH